MKAALLVVLACAVTAPGARAQEKFADFTYTIGFPTGDTKDFIDNTSWLGFGVEGRDFFRPNLSYGLSFQWNVFYGKETSTISFESIRGSTLSGDVTGNQYRNFNAYQILANGHVYAGRDEGKRPFLGLNAGAYAIRNLFEIGILSFSETTWHFGLAPEAGIIIPTGQFGETLVLLSVRYTYIFGADDSIDYSWVGLNFGFGAFE